MENRDEFIVSRPSEDQQDKTGAIQENTTDKVIIPVVEEQVTVGKRVVEKATVRVSKSVHEFTQQVSVSLMNEEVVVLHFEKNEFVDTPPPAVRYEGDVMIISVLKEVPVVTKRMMLVEEVHVSTKKNQKNETVDVVLKREEVTVDRTEINNP